MRKGSTPTKVPFDLVDLAYEAALDPTLWSQFLARLSAATGAVAATLADINQPAGTSNINTAVGVDPSYLRIYDEIYKDRNPWVHSAVRPMEGQVILSAELVPDSQLTRTPFYQEFLRPQDHVHLISGIALARGPELVTFNQLRTARAGPFGPRETALVRLLLPHVRRAIFIHRRFDALEGGRKRTEEILDRLPVGIIITDGRGRIRTMNRAARAIVDADDGLALYPSGIGTYRHDETRRLTELIRETGLTSEARALHSGGALRVTRPSGAAPYAVMVAPLRGKVCALDHEGPTVAVFVSDPGCELRLPENTLRSLYGLTRAEARLAAALVRGRGLEEAADEECVSIHTARTHLKHIFLKTDTRRQSDLIRLLLLSAAFGESNNGTPNQQGTRPGDPAS